MTDAKAPSVGVTYTVADIYGALFHAWRRFLRFFVIIELLWIVLSIGADVLRGATLIEAVGWLPFRLLLIGGLLLAVLWFGLCPLLGYARLKRAGVLGPNTISLVDKGIRIETPKADSVVYWPAIRRTVRTSSRLYLFLITTGAIIVPRRAFANDVGFESFVQAARQGWAAGRPS